MKSTSLGHEVGKEILRHHATRSSDSHRVLGAALASFGLVVAAYIFLFPKAFNLNDLGKDLGAIAAKAGQAYQEQIEPVVLNSKEAYEIFKKELLNGAEARAMGVAKERSGFPKIEPKVTQPIETKQ